MNNVRTLAAVALAIAAVAPLASTRAADLSPLDWPTAGNGPDDDHLAPFEFLLQPRTVPFLKLRGTLTADGDVEGTPTVQGRTLYFTDNAGSVWHVDAVTGRVLWKASMPAITGIQGSYSRNSPAIGDGVVIVSDDTSGVVAALSQATGAVVWKTTLAANIGVQITGSALVVHGRVLIGVSSNQATLAAFTPGFVVDFRGSVASLDEATGRIVWQTYTVPEGFTGGSVWSASTLSYDPVRNAVFVNTGNNYSVPSAVAACQIAAGSDDKALEACLPADDHIDSILSLNATTGAVNWASRFTYSDTFTTSCIEPNPATPCPTPHGLDTDLGAGTNLFTVTAHGRRTDVVGGGQKSGAYYALDRDTGATVWGVQGGPGGQFGGIIWGTATDGQRVYISEGNSSHVETTLVTSGVTTNGGYWSALDANTGRILWQTPTTALAPVPALAVAPQPPAGALASTDGSVTIANGVMYGEDAAGNLVALNAATGAILFDYPSGGSGIVGPAISNGTLYWPSGYYLTGATSNKLYEFSLFP